MRDGLHRHTWIICKELIPIQRREKSTPKGPRRAFKVTCAIQFSKSVRRFRLFPQEKADAESSLVWKGSQTTSFPEVYLSGTGNIGAVPRACQPLPGDGFGPFFALCHIGLCRSTGASPVGRLQAKTQSDTTT